MNTTLVRRARKVLVTGLAAGALTAGLGLATTAAAQAAPAPAANGKVCISNLSGTAKISNADGRSFTTPAKLNSSPLCLTRLGGTTVSDHGIYWKSGQGVFGEGSLDLSTTDIDLGSVKIDLSGYVAPDLYVAGVDSPIIDVPVTITKSGNYYITENIGDSRGDHSETTITFRVDFSK